MTSTRKRNGDKTLLNGDSYKFHPAMRDLH